MHLHVIQSVFGFWNEQLTRQEIEETFEEKNEFDQSIKFVTR